MTWSEASKMLKTDAQGRFRLAGQPKIFAERENYLTITVDNEPYIKLVKLLKDPQGLGPARLEITLKRGVWVEGRVANRASGKPVKAVVTYFPFRDNPERQGLSGRLVSQQQRLRRGRVPDRCAGAVPCRCAAGPGYPRREC